MSETQGRIWLEIKPFHDLTLDELHDIFWVRNMVFVVGQGITAEPEIDGRDRECAHALLWLDGVLVGTTRIFNQESPCAVGRVAVLDEHQGKGLGSMMMQKVQDYLDTKPGELHAQAHLEEWYSSLGWERVGEPFVEAEILHVTMRWPKKS